MKSELTRKVEAWDDVIRWIVTLSAAYIPLLMSPITIDAFELPKATVLYLSTIVLLAAFLIRSFHAGKLLLGRSPLDLPVLLFICIATASVLTSPNPILSIIGQYTYYESILTVYCFAVLYFMASRFINNNNRVGQMLTHMITAFSLVSLYGLMQHFGIDVRQPFLRTPNEHIGSTLGNPVLLGGYAALMLPIVFNAIIDSYRESSALKISKPVLVATFALGTTIMVLTQARGAWIGLIAGLLFVLIARHKDLANSTAMIGISAVATIILTIVALAIPAQIQTQTVNSKTNIAGSAINTDNTKSTNSLIPSEASLIARKELWKSAALMIFVRPVSGYGPDQAYNWWPRFQTLNHAKLKLDSAFDRPHNEFLQTTINYGVPGLLAFLWILTMLAFAVIKGTKNTHLAIAGGLIAYFIQAFFGVAAIGIYSIVWTLIGATAPAIKKKPEFEFAFKPSAQQLAIVFTSLIVMLMSVSVLKPFIADFYNFKGTLYRHSGNTAGAVREYGTAIKFNPNQPVYRNNIALIYYEQAKKTNNARLTQEGMSIVEQGLRINPNDSSLMLEMAIGYRISALITKENSLFDTAELYYGRVIEASPHFTTPRRAMLGMLLTKEHYDNAIEQALIILELDPSDIEVKYRLGLAYEKTGKIGKARRIYGEVLEKDPSITDARIALARVR